jgi:hypothetical protein
MESKGLYAVVTGDIVGSSQLGEGARARLHRVMRGGSSALRGHFAAGMPYEIDIFRGDGWQFLLSDPSQALRAGLSYRVYIRVGMQSRSLDTRMSIAVGGVSYLPEEPEVSSGDGEAFRLSGEGLERLSRRRRMVFHGGKAVPQALGEGLDALVQLIDELATHWTIKQAQAVAGALWGWTQAHIGASWPQGSITQQAVAQHLGRAGWNAVDNALDYFEGLMVDLAEPGRG